MINNNDREILIKYRKNVQDMQEDMIDFIERINSFLSTKSE